MYDSNLGEREPIGCTLGDLMALTLGVAIAASLGWYGRELPTITIGSRPAPDWYILAHHGRELIQKSCLALIPLILARRILHGGPLRPAEYLPILTGISPLLYWISRWPGFGLYVRSIDPPHSLTVNPESYYIFELCELFLGIMAATLLILTRKRRRDWITGLEVAVAWQELIPMLGYYYQGWANGRLVMLSEPVQRIIPGTFLVQLPQQIFFYFPTMIAVIDLTRGPRRRRTWVEWAAIIIALPLPFYYEALNLSRMAIDPGNKFFYLVRLVGQILAFAGSYALARWSEPRWRILLEGSQASPISQADRVRSRRSDIEKHDD